MEPKYDCENYGDQGITAGCKDIYYYNIDCQWIDVTELPLGTYTFKMAINPEYKVSQLRRTWEGMKEGDRCVGSGGATPLPGDRWGRGVRYSQNHLYLY